MLATRCLPRKEVFFFKMFSGVHIFRKLGFQVLDQPIAAFQADKYKKHYKTSSEILTLVNMSIENADSLKDMIDALNADSLLRQAFGYVKPIQQSQLSRDLRQWDLGMFQQILQTLLELAKARQVFNGLTHAELIQNLAGLDLTFLLGKQVVALDSTFKILNPTTYPTVEYGYCTLTGRKEPGLKAHLALNVTVDAPIGLKVTSGAVHDSTQFTALLSWVSRVLDPKEVILTYDKAYYKIDRFDELGKTGYWFVTPLKKNSLNRARILSFEEYSQDNIRVTDRVVRLNTGTNELRAVHLANQATGEEFRLLTNVRDAEATTLQSLYEARWQIEILFRAVKQCFGLKTKRPIGRSLNAVMVQIFCAIIAYLALSIYRSLVFGGMTVFELKRQIKYARKSSCQECHAGEWGRRCRDLNLTPMEGNKF
ncbi:MAG: IS4 family transposase [Candidatus Heimdallarchaeota archaeon]